MRRHMNMKTAIHRLLLLSLLGSLSACTDSFAAGQHSQVAARRVTFADLDLTRNRGAATLYSRIQSAAREVCEPASANWRFKSLTGTHRCVELAINRAVNEINADCTKSNGPLHRNAAPVALTRRRIAQQRERARDEGSAFPGGRVRSGSLVGGRPARVFGVIGAAGCSCRKQFVPFRAMGHWRVQPRRQY